MMRYVCLGMFCLVLLGAASPSPTPAPSLTPTPAPSPVKSFTAMCNGISWQAGTLFTTTLGTIHEGYTLTITGPAPACTWGTVETITVSP